ncbi:hypothetical protein LXL04_034236 [Taraxacum kok-saghyz]
MAKWEGKASTKITKATADKIWPCFVDFFNIHKYYPSMSICYGIHGVNGEVGCIRYCSGFSFRNDADSDWVKSRLVALDPNEMTLKYEILECSFGFKSHLGTYKIIPSGVEGCTIEWSFTVDPVEGITCQNVVDKYQDILDHMTKKMEDSMDEKNDL